MTNIYKLYQNNVEERHTFVIIKTMKRLLTAILCVFLYMASLPLQASATLYLIPVNDSIQEGDSVMLDVYLGEDQTLVDSLKYLQFDIEVDTTHLGYSNFKFNNYNNNFFGNIGSDYTFSIDTLTPPKGTIRLVYNVNTLPNSSNIRILGLLKLIVEDDVPGVYWSVFKIKNVVAKSGGGNNIYLNPLDTEVLLIENVLQGLPLEILKEKIKVYPNPTKNYIHIETKEIVVDNIEIYDLAGNIIYSTPHTTIDCSQWQAGMYLLLIHSDKGDILYRCVKSD